MSSSSKPAGDTSADAARDDGLSEAEVAKQRMLKAVVIGLGIMILLAFAGVVAGMAYRAAQIGKGAPGAPPARTSAPASSVLTRAGEADAALRSDLKLSLPAGSTVRSSTLSGSRLVVVHDGPSGAAITILDLASGHVVSQITIEAAPR